MKKFILALTAMSMIATPAMAQHRNGHYRYDNHQRYHRDRGVSTGEAVAIGIGALILGAVISNNQRNKEREQPRTYVESPPVWNTPADCVAVRRIDPYGNVYYERYCK